MVIKVSSLVEQEADKLGISRELAHWMYEKTIIDTISGVVQTLKDSEEQDKQYISKIAFRLPKLGTFKISYIKYKRYKDKGKR